MNNEAMKKQIAESEKLYDEFAHLLTKPAEKTIFSIGSRGHYENPTSDILAFYLDPNEEHGLGDIVLNAMLKFTDIGNDLGEYAGLSVEREVSTDNGNRIDLLLHCDAWALAIENKIYHDAKGNPFGDYKKHIKNQFKADKYRFVLLSLKNDQADGWCSVQYKKLIEKIEHDLDSAIVKQPFSKWRIFLRDFLLNLKQLCEHTNMTDQEIRELQADIEKFEKHFPKILEQIKNMKSLNKSFCEKILERGKIELNKEAIPTAEFTGNLYPKADPFAIYFYPQNEGHIQLKLNIKSADKEWRIGFYISTETDEERRSGILNNLGDFEIENIDKPERIVKKSYENVDAALTDIVKLAKIIYHQPN